VGAPHDFDAIYREAAARLWRSLYAYTAGREDIAHDAMAEAFARALAPGSSILTQVAAWPAGQTKDESQPFGGQYDRPI
jgi:DNA-directed RNA polymerase specialized sigma24 family protein